MREVKRLRTPEEQFAIEREYRRIDEAVVRMWHEQNRKVQRRRKVTAFVLIGCIFVAATIILDALMGVGR